MMGKRYKVQNLFLCLIFSEVIYTRFLLHCAVFMNQRCTLLCFFMLRIFVFYFDNRVLYVLLCAFILYHFLKLALNTFLKMLFKANLKQKCWKKQGNDLHDDRDRERQRKMAHCWLTSRIGWTKLKPGEAWTTTVSMSPTWAIFHFLLCMLAGN